MHTAKRVARMLNSQGWLMLEGDFYCSQHTKIAEKWQRPFSPEPVMNRVTEQNVELTRTHDDFFFIQCSYDGCLKCLSFQF